MSLGDEHLREEHNIVVAVVPGTETTGRHSGPIIGIWRYNNAVNITILHLRDYVVVIFGPVAHGDLDVGTRLPGAGSSPARPTTRPAGILTINDYHAR